MVELISYCLMLRELNKVINIYFVACEYRDDYWKDIVDCFEKSTLKIEGIPQDIINVLDGLMIQNFTLRLTLINLTYEFEKKSQIMFTKAGNCV